MTEKHMKHDRVDVVIIIGLGIALVAWLIVGWLFLKHVDLVG